MGTPPARLTPAEVAAEIERNAGLIYRLARQLVAANPGARLDVEDLAQEIRVGLLLSADRFDPGRGVKFATYAMHRGRRLALEYVRREKAGGVKIPANRWVALPMASLDAPCGDGGTLAGLVAGREAEDDED